MKPLTEPSAYRDTISPMCRKLEAESDMVRLLRRRRRSRRAAGHSVPALRAELGASACLRRAEEPGAAGAGLLLAAATRGLQRRGRAPLPLRAAMHRVCARARVCVCVCTPTATERNKKERNQEVSKGVDKRVCADFDSSGVWPAFTSWIQKQVSRRIHI